MEDENNVAASAEVSATEPMTLDSALGVLNAQDEAPEQNETAASETSAGEETGDEADQAEASSEERETDAISEAEPEAELVLHGNAKTRLRNGQEVTIGDLKKRWEEAEEYKAKLPEIETRAREIEQKQQAIAAQEQYFTQTIQQAQAVLRAKAPPKPDYAAYERGEIDIITFTEQQAKWNAFANDWQNLERARQTQAQEVERRQAHERQQHIARETERVIERIPEFKDPAARRAFAMEAAQIGSEAYGMPEGVMDNLTDAWAVLALKDAIAYRKLQAEKAKVAEKVKDVPPVQVQAPGRRVSPAEKQAVQVKQGFERLRKTGSFDDALQILNSMED